MTYRTTRSRTLLATVALVGATSLTLAGCATSEQEGSSAGSSTDKATAAGLDLDLYAAAVAEAKTIAGDTKLDPTLEYIGGNSGSEAEILQAVYQAFTDATGTEIEYTGSGSSTATAATTQSRVDAGNPPDVVDMGLGVAKGYAEAGDTLDLTATIGADTLAQNYAPSLLESLSSDGKVFGITQGFSNFMVWYNPTVYTGPTDPATWTEISDWTDTAAQSGVTPWCIAEEAGAGSGFPGTQFIESMFAKMYGPEALQQWSTGDLAWTSPEVTSAWEAFGDIATVDSKVSGGVTGSLSASIATGSNGLISDPATCQLDLWGSWVPGLIGEGVEPEDNLDFFPIPGDVPEYASTEIFNAGATVVLNDTPTSEAFITFLASAPAQTLLASANHWTVANKAVTPDTYTSPLLKKTAELYFTDDTNLVAPPDIMSSAAVVAAFNKGVVSYLQDPSSLDTVLAGIEAAAQG